MTYETFLSCWQVYYVNTVKFFFLYTPFFALSMFLCLTSDYSVKKRRQLSGRIIRAAFIISVILLFIGNAIFKIFGVTLDAFRVGVGITLLLSGIGLVKGRTVEATAPTDEDISVVPMALPVIVGPATIGTILVMGTELKTIAEKLSCVAAMATALAAIWIMLYLANTLEEKFGRRILEILSKITGLILASLAAQIILTGVKGFLY